MPGCAGTSATSCRSASGAGGVFSALRTLRIVDAPTRWPSLSSSPWILYPQPLFSSVASCSMRAAISALTGGRPVRLGQMHLRVTRRRCQRRTVPGVTSRCARSLAGRSRTSAARTLRGRPSREPGPGTGMAQHGDLVPQHLASFGVLEVLMTGRAGPASTAQPREDEVEQAKRHG